MAIKRIWHGWTTPEQADVYENMLHTDIFPGIVSMNIPGFHGVELLRRDEGHEVGFVTIMTFDSTDNVIAFQGEDYEVAYVPPQARAVLSRWDDRAVHYEIRGGS